MKTTLIIDDGLMRRLKALAAETGQTLSAVVEGYLRAGLSQRTTRAAASGKDEPPAWDLGEPMVDVADREALESALLDLPRSFPRPTQKQKTRRRARR